MNNLGISDWLAIGTTFILFLITLSLYFSAKSLLAFSKTIDNKITLNPHDDCMYKLKDDSSKQDSIINTVTFQNRNKYLLPNTIYVISLQTEIDINKVVNTDHAKVNNNDQLSLSRAYKFLSPSSRYGLSDSNINLAYVS